MDYRKAERYLGLGKLYVCYITYGFSSGVQRNGSIDLEIGTLRNDVVHLIETPRTLKAFRLCVPAGFLCICAHSLCVNAIPAMTSVCLRKIAP